MARVWCRAVQPGKLRTGLGNPVAVSWPTLTPRATPITILPGQRRLTRVGAPKGSRDARVDYRAWCPRSAGRRSGLVVAQAADKVLAAEFVAGDTETAQPAGRGPGKYRGHHDAKRGGWPDPDRLSGPSEWPLSARIR